MITTKKGVTTISGSAAEIATDLEVIIRSVKRAFAQGGVPKELAEHLVADAIRGADMTTEEKARDLLSAIAKKFAETIR